MEIIAHRINTLKSLRLLYQKYGTEIDLRAKGSNIILNHEPYSLGDKFIDYLNEYKHGTLVCNIKESGIENDVIKLLKEHNIKKYFLLDVEMPYLYEKSKNKFKKIAVRFSEYENIINSKFFINKLDWLWVDTVTRLPINSQNLKIIKKYKSCLVCPERWGRVNDISLYFKKLKKLNYYPNAVMTSIETIKIWESLLQTK